jgi:hypothetical protein
LVGVTWAPPWRWNARLSRLRRGDVVREEAAMAEQIVTLPYPAWMGAAERRARDAVRAAVRHYAALDGLFPDEEERRYQAMLRAFHRLRKVQEAAGGS